MCSTGWLMNRTVLSSEIVFDWKFSFMKVTFLFRPTILLRLISLSHWATKVLLCLVQLVVIAASKDTLKTVSVVVQV